jgi:hypothetical protein
MIPVLVSLLAALRDSAGGAYAAAFATYAIWRVPLTPWPLRGAPLPPGEGGRNNPGWRGPAVRHSYLAITQAHTCMTTDAPPAGLSRRHFTIRDSQFIIALALQPLFNDSMIQ